MPKERNYNPAQAQHKADKAKAIKKGKAEQQARRNEKLAQRNPDRIQQQIDDLKAIEASGTKLTHVEQQSLEALEKDLKAVKKAREALGDKAPTFAPRRDGGRGGYGGGGGVLGKRRRDEEDDASSGDDDVPEDVKRIPMPRDTPPPIPKEVLDAWYAKRRAKRGAGDNAHRGGDGDRSGDASGSGNANLEPLKENRLAGRVTGARPTPTPPAEVKTVYEAKPIVRDLKKEAVSAFVPTAVRMKLDKGRGKGGLLEPEEFDRLEEEGYLKASGSGSDSKGAQPPLPPSDMDIDQDDYRIEHRLHQTTLEEVEDEEG